MSDVILLMPLFHELRLVTNGVALSESTLDLDVPRFRNVLPRCQALFLIVNTTGLPGSTYMEWNVGFYSGFDRNNEDASRHSISTSPFDTNGPLRPSEYTTTTDFLLESRLQVWWRNKAAISGVYSCLASGVLGCRLYGS